MTGINASYQFDLDPRYGWVSAISEDGDHPIDFVIQQGGRCYGYTFNGGNFEPTCVCSAWSAGECCCETGRWEDHYT